MRGCGPTPQNCPPSPTTPAAPPPPSPMNSTFGPATSPPTCASRGKEHRLHAPVVLRHHLLCITVQTDACVCEGATSTQFQSHHNSRERLPGARPVHYCSTPAYPPLCSPPPIPVPGRKTQRSGDNVPANQKITFRPFSGSLHGPKPQTRLHFGCRVSQSHVETQNVCQFSKFFFTPRYLFWP